ncbi:hypothetical protein J1605_000321 [Eschrichtius robustus]|uniref:Secreted protein n=1 Tax=Eschrichtius robustus TaxID=9764 RepID=A0AB34HQJ1_ESCRO|nr:hypothetical protein J1605_000321 [Eschrichtius robustus]
MQEHRGGIKLYFNLHISFPVLLLPLHLTPYLQSDQIGTSLVVQSLRICLPMQGTRVRALVREVPTCRGATKPVRHNY